ncbi:hypothetical protein C8259_21185 [Nocardia nova]|uniref:Uncharacterized protein n=1 Tax=Nocardia nova TaxID=37330 RepID=A0A2T2YZW4_9NOCA|nr:hypothetical protein C8259_21185 [Nocardia nova]
MVVNSGRSNPGPPDAIGAGEGVVNAYPIWSARDAGGGWETYCDHFYRVRPVGTVSTTAVELRVTWIA